MEKIPEITALPKSIFSSDKNNPTQKTVYEAELEVQKLEIKTVVKRKVAIKQNIAKVYNTLYSQSNKII